jgi:hypothetical protein
MSALVILEKDPAVACISVHALKPDFVADDILRAVRCPCNLAYPSILLILKDVCNVYMTE